MGLFESLYDPFMVPMDWIGLRRWRQWAASVSGERVLEVGVGTGLNLAHFGRMPTVCGVDPNPLMLGRARCRTPRVEETRLRLLQAEGERLPFSDGVFDGAVATLVFCTVADPMSALLEIRRVLKPKASMRLVEHVRLNHRVGSCIQDLLTPVWKRLAGGCRLNRDTLRLVEKAGFRVMAVKRRMQGLLIGIEAVIPPDVTR
jgi:ubiquinone/menaquinone biosynthesis C-methylase UbiE